jgi:uncharacterized protein YjcR
MHGAGGGAPKGNRNALKHGAHIAKARALASRHSASETRAGFWQLSRAHASR